MIINNYNINDVTTGVITEPVTLQEAKDYMRLSGFVDLNESPSTDLSDFNFDDNFIDELITAVRECIEQTCLLSLVPKSLKGVITNECGMIEIPFGPVKSINSLKDSDGNAIADYTLSGILGGFVNLKYPCFADMVIEYTAGYGGVDMPTIPKAIKLDMLRLIQYYYDNRAETVGGGILFSKLAQKYSRNIWL